MTPQLELIHRTLIRDGYVGMSPAVEAVSLVNREFEELKAFYADARRQLVTLTQENLELRRALEEAMWSELQG